MKSAVKLDWSENIFLAMGHVFGYWTKKKKFLDGESFAHPGKKLKIEMGTGTVGNVVFSGYSINLQDAQKNPKHDKEEDSKTTSFLCVKIGDLMGRPLGMHCITQ